MIQKNTKVAEPKIPADFAKVLASSSAKVKEVWKDITPVARRDWITWIESAKQPETRKRRIEQTPSKIAAGKRRPCCYAVVPMNLYKALGMSPKAKATWSTLNATEKRDLSDWVGIPKTSNEKRDRVDKVLSALMVGKKHV